MRVVLLASSGVYGWGVGGRGPKNIQYSCELRMGTEEGVKREGWDTRERRGKGGK